MLGEDPLRKSKNKIKQTGKEPLRKKVAKEELDCYLALVMLFLAATSLAVRGSGRDVGMGEFWRRKATVFYKSVFLGAMEPGDCVGLTRRFGTGHSFPASLKAK